MSDAAITHRRPRLLVVLQTEATIFMSLCIGQAGLAAAFLTGQKPLKAVHEVNAFLLAAIAVLMLVTAVVYRRRGGSRWIPYAAGLLVVLIIAQISLGELKVAGLHIFLGVIYVVLAVLFTSYLFRPGFTPRSVVAPTR